MIGFDTATKTGWAFRGMDGKWRAGVVDPSDTTELLCIIYSAAINGHKSAIIEDCYMGRNIKTLKVLQDCQTRIICACERWHVTYRLVQPKAWQTDYGIAGNRKDTKAGALAIASVLLRQTNQNLKLTSDMADAICIADYGDCLERAERCTS